MVILAGVSEGVADHWGFQEGVEGGIPGGICGVCLRECGVWGVWVWGVEWLNSAGTMVVKGRNERRFCAVSLRVSGIFVNLWSFAELTLRAS